VIFISKISKLYRLSDWWTYILPPVLGLVYIQVLIYALKPEKIYIDFLLFIFSFIGTASFGFLLNDTTDINEDFQAGKRNHVANLSVPKRYLLLCLSFIISGLPWLFITYNPAALSFLVLQVLLLIIYSVPPVRLKRFKYPAVFTDAFYSSVLPSLIALFLFAYNNNYYNVHWLFLLIISLCMLLKGVRNIIVHQIEDFNNDVRINAKTLVVSNGIIRSQGFIYRIILPLELLSLLGFIVSLASIIDLKTSYIILFLCLLLVYAYSIKRITTQYKFAHYFINDFYGDFLPVFILILLGLGSNYFLIFLAFHFLIFRKKPLFLLFSYLVNHFLYHRIIVWLYYKMFCNQYVQKLFKKSIR